MAQPKPKPKPPSGTHPSVSPPIVVKPLGKGK
jgi:hypothetical protein